MEAVRPDRRLAGRYVLEERIAPGGMATVWRGHDDVLARTVAIKCLRDELARDPDFAARFQREAINAARLNHPNIISIFDTGVDDGVYFIVMEYFPGRNFRQLLSESGPLDPQRAAALILPVISALGFAHQNEVIHRDVKPANILVADDGRVKVADFGIAKAAFTQGDLTTTGTVLGTVQYLSPEQVEEGDLDGRSDLYSVGVVLYEMVAGRVPFVADNHVATAMMRLTQDPVPPSALRAGIPRELDSVIMRAMARRPEERFSSAESMGAALERFAGAGDLSATRPVPVTTVQEAPSAPAPSRSSTFRAWMLVPLVLLVLGALVIAGGLAIGRLELGGPLGVRVAPTASPRTESRSQQIRVVSAEAFDPDPGDGRENSEDTGFAVDGELDTSWETERYDSEALGALKDGVGLWLDLGRTVRVQEVSIESSISGWTFELKNAMEVGAPALQDEQGQTSFEARGGPTVVQLPSVPTNGLLIWITGLGSSGGEGFRASIAEVTVTGTLG
ncbi:MAG TPA: protein kinase [Actinomycetota bacterium]|nr:protein kinase [Actinomycetota bacterium]